MIKGHFELAPTNLDSQIRYVKHIFKGSVLLEALNKTHSICRKYNFEAFNLLEGVNPIQTLWHKDRNYTQFSVLNVFSFIFLKTYWVSWGSYMSWSQFVLLNEKG